MVSLRCTAKLLKRLKLDSVGEPPNPTTTLGDWFANIIYTKSGHFLLLVSAKSRLPLLMSARDLDRFESRFKTMLREQLIRYGASEEAVDLELHHMSPFHFGKTNDRSVLGTINEMTREFRLMLSLKEDYTIYEWSDYFAETLCGPIRHQFPRDLAVDLVMQRIRYSI